MGVYPGISVVLRFNGRAVCEYRRISRNATVSFSSKLSGWRVVRDYEGAPPHPNISSSVYTLPQSPTHKYKEQIGVNLPAASAKYHV
jgi:hypothetical protein